LKTHQKWPAPLASNPPLLITGFLIIVHGVSTVLSEFPLEFSYLIDED
jgi:hypothetical protein